MTDTRTEKALGKSFEKVDLPFEKVDLPTCYSLKDKLRLFLQDIYFFWMQVYVYTHILDLAILRVHYTHTLCFPIVWISTQVSISCC